MTNPNISINMIDAIMVQTELFALIKEYVGSLSPQILEREAIAQDNFWRTMRYRSVLLTLDVQEPENNREYPYGWFIYYHQSPTTFYESPTILILAEKLHNPDRWEKRQSSLDLAKESYFQLPDDYKQKIISDFVRKSLEYIKYKSA